MSPASSSRSASRVRLLRESTTRRASSCMRSFPPSAFSSSHSTSYHASGGSFASASAASILSISVACAVSSTAQAWPLRSWSLVIEQAALWQEVVAFATSMWQHIVAFATIYDVIPTFKEKTMLKQIDREELRRKLAGNARPVLVEALPEKYWRDWHLPGARHLPHDEVDRLAPGVLPDKAAEIVVYCASRSCRNSHVAAHRLEQLGYENVAIYPGGKQDWMDAGFPVDRGEALAA